MGHNRLEVIAIVIRNKQVQLDRTFLLFFGFRMDKNKTKTTVPTLRFPGGFKIAAHVVKPMQPLFYHALDRYESLKGNAEGEFDITIKESFNNVLTKYWFYPRTLVQLK